jgi:hypothetical protein
MNSQGAPLYYTVECFSEKGRRFSEVEVALTNRVVTGQRREDRAGEGEAVGERPCRFDGARRPCEGVHRRLLPWSEVATEARESSWRVPLALPWACEAAIV